MQSGIYEGFVRHRRFEPISHVFHSRLYMMYLDLDELSTVFRGRWLWSIEKWNIASFRRRDHVGEASDSLDKTIRNLVEFEAGSRPSGPIWLLTHLSYFGYCFNPLSLFFCFDADDQRLHSIVAEVTNTPWGERHCYVLLANLDRRDSTVPGNESHNGAASSKLSASPLDDSAIGTRSGHSPSRPRELKPIPKQSFIFNKTLHVSPFMPMDFEYRWRLSGPTDQLVLHTENWREDRVYFDATMTLSRREITTWSLTRVLLVYPFMTLQVIANIHWQAFWLWWKKVPYISHPKTRQVDSSMKNSASNTQATSTRK